MTLDAPPPPVSTMRRDIVSAYLASGMKVASWAMVTALVVRYGPIENLAILTLVRSTLGLLSLTTLGLAPAMMRMVGEVASPTLRTAKQVDASQTVYANGLLLASVLALVGSWLVQVYAENFGHLHHTPELPRLWVIQYFVLCMGGGLLFRLLSEAPSARIQVGGYIWLDNLLLAGGELLWVWITWWSVSLTLNSFGANESLNAVGGGFLLSGGALLLVRLLATLLIDEPFEYRPAPIRWQIIRTLLGFGLLVSIAQLADFLYAPTDYILINRLLNPALGSVYAPAVQIDSALLLVVGAIASVLLPKTVVAHVAGNTALVRKYYRRGTLTSFALLLAAAITVWVLAPWIFKLWLDNPMPATQAILPLILIHTVVGGSSAVGRSILLGMGKVKPFTVAVLVAGVSNVVLSYSFVRFFGLGLHGIVLGTICAVVGRCAIWQPWYVWKCLGENSTDEKTVGSAISKF